MIELDGKLYDGSSSRAAPVSLQLFEDGELHVEGAGRSVVLLARSLRISERLGRAPRWIELGGDARVEVPDSEELERWGAVAGAAAVTLFVGFAAVQFGVPALASLVARALPASLDRELGEGVLEAFDESMFEASELPDARRQELTALFARLESVAHLAFDARLEFRSGGAIGANAFALPNGVVVLTDELVAHAGTLPALLVQLQYSRDFELEADAFAQRVMSDASLDRGALGRMLTRLEQAHAGANVPAYLSSHPATDERVRAPRDAR